MYFGEAPVSAPACVEAEKQQKPASATRSTPPTRTYFKNVYYWNTPTKTCLDGRGDICTDFDAWTKAWTEITGA